MAEPYVFFRWPVQGREYRRAALGALASESLHMSDIALRRRAAMELEVGSGFKLGPGGGA
jgi:hypothetical protein